MRAGILTLLLFLSSAFAQVPAGEPTPFDAPVLDTITNPERILSAIRNAKEHIFLVIPGLDSQTLLETLGDTANRLVVYVVMSDGKDAMASDLSRYGAQVRLINNTAEGLMLIDYEQLYVGGLISGTEAQTQYIDLGAYGNSTLISQMQALWQAATPFGE